MSRSMQLVFRETQPVFVLIHWNVTGDHALLGFVTQFELRQCKNEEIKMVAASLRLAGSMYDDASQCEDSGHCTNIQQDKQWQKKHNFSRVT